MRSRILVPDLSLVLALGTGAFLASWFGPKPAPGEARKRSPLGG